MTRNMVRSPLIRHLFKRPVKNEIEFSSHGLLTLGVEIEVQLIDPKTKNLTSRAKELLKEDTDFHKLKPEFYLSTLEINTAKCNTLQDVERDLTQSFDRLDALGQKVGVEFSTTGCHPFSRYADCVISPSERYADMIDRHQWLTRRMTVYGLHVHIGMKSGDDCIRFNNFYLHFLPHLLALSGSSPFWQGEDTGLSSCRPTTYEALPTAGNPYPVRSWQDFENLYKVLKKCDGIRSLKDMWWDLRPSPGYGTLEIRVCDGVATLSETLAIVAYIHLLAYWFMDHGEWLNQVTPPSSWIQRENKWRTMRHGLEASLVINGEGETRPIRLEIENWLEKLSPYTQKLGYNAYMETLRTLMETGNSSVRQRSVFAETKSLERVVDHSVLEFKARKPMPVI
jgi:carboxylate-amine ligase